MINNSMYAVAHLHYQKRDRSCYFMSVAEVLNSNILSQKSHILKVVANDKKLEKLTDKWRMLFISFHMYVLSVWLFQNFIEMLLP